MWLYQTKMEFNPKIKCSENLLTLKAFREKGSQNSRKYFKGLCRLKKLYLPGVFNNLT